MSDQTRTRATAPGTTREDAPRRAGEPLDFPAGTLVDLFLDGVERYREEEAMRRRRADDSWESFTRGEVAAWVRDLALGLRSLGFDRGDRVAILSDTRMEWALADFAMVMCGVVSVPVYPSLPPDQIRYILADAGARGIFVEGAESLEKLAEVWNELPELQRAFVFDPVDDARGLEIMTLGEMRERGREAPSALADGYEEYARKSDPDDVATFIYTSGTTGEPKGVMLTHANFHSNSHLSSRVLDLSPEDVHLSWLPLSHVFERMAGHYLMWLRGVCVAFAESVETVARDMGEVRPTVMTAVPRLYEKFYEAAAAKAREGGALKERIFRWAKRMGEARAERRLGERPVGPWLRLRHSVADSLVFGKLRARTGGRIRYFVSGGAPLSPEVGLFLWAADLPVLEGYGLTETSPVLCVNPPDDVRLGTVGPPIPGTEIRIADDGEILCRGPQIMKGYYGKEEATREAFTEDGWFRTGDIGHLDRDGYLAITDRKKEILVNSYGKNIAPAPVEAAAKRSRLVEYAVLVGDQMKFPVMVIQPAFEALDAWARKQGVETDGRSELAGRPEVAETLEEEVSRETRDFPDHERPRAVVVVGDEFGIETGELTPTMKVKRRVVLEKYGEEIERTYREAERRWEARREGGEGAGEKRSGAGS